MIQTIAQPVTVVTRAAAAIIVLTEINRGLAGMTYTDHKLFQAPGADQC